MTARRTMPASQGPHPRTGLRWLVACAVVALLAGCTPTPRPIVPRDLRPEAQQWQQPVPDYGQIAQLYNANLAALDQLRARANVNLVYRDDKSKRREESGDGLLLFQRPMNFALSVGKLNITGLWLGSNDELYYLFDEQADLAYVGRHEFVGRPCSQPLPLAIRPEDVLLLLGLVPLDPTLGHVEPMQGYVLVEPAGLPVRYLLDPQTALPVRADLLDPLGRSIIVARMAQPQRVELREGPRDAWPQLMTDAQIYLIDGEARLELELSNLTDGRGDGAMIAPAAFDFDRLVRARRPDEIIDLDAGCLPAQ